MLLQPVAHIDLEKLRTNVRIIRKHIDPGHPLMATIKANAYGHGLTTIGEALEADNVEWLAVATGEEALALREAGIATKILVLTPVLDATLIAQLAELGVRLTATDEHVLRLYELSGAGKQLHVHLKVDTGMGRLGWMPSDPEMISTAAQADAAHTLEGVFTHFGRSDENQGREATYIQLDRFEQALSKLSEININGLIRHTANTAAAFMYPESHYDLVRSGIALYGYNPSDAVHSQHDELQPIARVEAPIVSSRPVPTGTTIGYGSTMITDRSLYLHTVRFGYADGYPRVVNAPPFVSARNDLHPVSGRVCMDQIMFTSEEQLPIGEPVTIFGGPDYTADNLAASAGTVNYEMLTSLGNRVVRNYLNR